MRHLIMLLAVFAIVVSCKDNVNENEKLSQVEFDANEIIGYYTFKLFDQNGNVVKQGNFSLQPNNELYSGSWQSTDNDTGNVLCMIEDGEVYVHLNYETLLPQEYLLVGNPENSAIKGQWQFSMEVFSSDGFQGNFEANRQ